jgi:large subunit ribosomal protein L7/L12
MSEETKEEVVVPEKFKTLVKQIEELSVLELSELVKVLEEKFGVSAAAPAMMMAAPAAGAGAAEAEEKSDFDIELVAGGDSKIGVIKIVKELTGKGLKEAKDLVDGAPTVIKEKVPKAEAEEIKKQLMDAGATVNLK